MRTVYYSLTVVTTLLIFLFASCKKDLEEQDLKGKAIFSINPDSLYIPVNEYKPHFLQVWFCHPSQQYYITYREETIWYSSHPEIAKVDKYGQVYGLKIGETNIVAIINNGADSLICKVTVFDNMEYKYRITLKDKGNSSYSINRPGEFLSSKAIERRNRQNIGIDESDLPISPEYIKYIEKTGAVVVATSKWLHTVTVYTIDQNLPDKLKELPFVEEITMVWLNKRNFEKSAIINKDILQRTNFVKSSTSLDSSYYGASWHSVKLNNGQILHELGYKGAGIDIAVIDAGFIDLRTNPSLSNLNIKGAKSFIYEDTNPFNTDSHGVWVLSCMATNMPGLLVGTAPEADYWLFRTEDLSSEYPVEQDYLVAALEYADSVGVDIVNTSLYYTSSDLSSYDYNYEGFDGKTELASKGVNKAAEKGIFIVCCAGNTNSWVGTPGDSPNVLTVGSVGKTGLINDFTSYGITVDGRIKPDVVALGESAGVINRNGYVDFRSGTSYASPNICGLVACLWQAYPTLTNIQLLEIVRESADRYENPVIPYGYGIPDMQKAMQLAQEQQIEN